MYDFYYNVSKNQFEDDITLFYVDTDAYIFELKNHDYYEFMKEHSELILLIIQKITTCIQIKIKKQSEK